MAKKTFTLNDFTSSNYKNILDECTKLTSAPLNGEIKELDSKILYFEEKYKTNSEKMRKLIKSGEQSETNDICDWLMCLNKKDLLNGKTR